MRFDEELAALSAAGNLRRLPHGLSDSVVDLSGNDYLGLGADTDLRDEFFSLYPAAALTMSSCASRLLASEQRAYDDFEGLLAESYSAPGRTLMFNSGYHANTGLVSALADKSTLIVADRLVHASIIDGMRLSGADFIRFRHNDCAHLRQILDTRASAYSTILIIVESVYSMDGDRAPLAEIAEIKRSFPGALLYVDEAHAVGVEGPAGLGLSAASGVSADVDILIGTLGKALASMGAYAIFSSVTLREYAVNRARALIFSTALPPAQALWSRFIWEKSLGADTARSHLRSLSRHLAKIIPGGAPSHIRPLIVGDAARAVELSRSLLADGFNVMAIRTPTVPPHTERLRFSLSASISDDTLARLGQVLNQHLTICSTN